MRKFLLPIIILLTIISCGKKKQVIASGAIEENGHVYATWEEFINNDSAFVVYTDAASGKINRIKKAENEAALRDSTYSVEYYFIPSGKLMTVQRYTRKKPDGKWLSFFENGKMAGETVFENGLMQHYTLWFENGKVQTKGELLPDSIFRHREYFESGLPKKEMTADKNGKGQCTYFYTNGKTRETGPVMNFNACGIWKIYDTLGNLKHDTVYGMQIK